MIEKYPNRDFSLFLRDVVYFVALNCFGRKNEVYASTVEIAREFSL